VIETGVWRGGCAILMRAVLVAHGADDRTVWPADSFQGVPPPAPDEFPADLGDPHHAFDHLRVSQAQVEANFSFSICSMSTCRACPAGFATPCRPRRSSKSPCCVSTGTCTIDMDRVGDALPDGRTGGFVIADN
jgi:hypothetical protein